MKCYKATLTFPDGKVVEVRYPADHPVPNQAALEAAQKAAGVPSFPQAPVIIHNRDGEPEEV